MTEIVLSKRRNKRKSSKESAVDGPSEQLFGGLSPEEGRAYALITAMERRFKVFYFVPHLPQKMEEASPLGWYTPGLHAAAEPLMVAATLPADIREPHTNRSSVLVQRLLRGIWPFVTPISINAVAEVHRMVGTPFQVFVTNDDTVADAVDLILKDVETPVLHASSIPGGGRISIRDLFTDGISKYTREVLDALASRDEWRVFVRQARQLISAEPQVRPRKHHLQAGHHNLVTPNEIALAAFGWKFHRSKPISQPLMADNSSETYISRICESADAVAEERERLLKGMPNAPRDHRYVLAVASVYWGHYENWRERVQETAPELREDLKRAYASVVQAKTYFDWVKVDEFGKPAVGKLYLVMNQLRRDDMRTFTAGLSLLAAASLVPVLRLEPRLNSIRGDLKMLADCTRAEAPRRIEWKTSRLMTRLGQKMRSLIAPPFLQRIDAPARTGQIEGMKLVSDLPLELLPTDGLPLGLRYDTSRLNPLPGNLFLQQCSLPPIVLPQERFEEILVIRSFAPDDRLKPLFERATSFVTTSEQTQRIRYRIVDVENEGAFVAALNDYEGAIVVFDCHGRFDETLGMGTLVIGGAPLNPWDLKNRIQMPPIVMFSACDTQPIDGSHSSVATAAFALGARAVLATILPIRAREAAVFSGRMSLRLAQFVPEALKYRTLLTWREVVSGMLRMSHCTEVLRRLMSHARLSLSEDEFHNVLLSANVAINGRKARWFEAFLEELATCSGRTLGSLKEDVERWAGMTEAMKHTQLGAPESIIIVGKYPEQVLAEQGLHSATANV